MGCQKKKKKKQTQDALHPLDGNRRSDPVLLSVYSVHMGVDGLVNAAMLPPAR